MKVKLKALKVAGLVLCCHFLSAQIPATGMIGGWPFTGNANDMSGSGDHGTVYGATLTADRFGVPNCAYAFNGKSNYIQMPQAGPLGSVSRSISFWEKTTSKVLEVCFAYGGPGNGGIYQIIVNYDCEGIGFDNSIAAIVRGTSPANDGVWHHIVAVLNSSVGTSIGSIDLYIDGVLQSSVLCFVTNTTSLVNSNAQFPITIGMASNAPARHFKGDLDDFYFYDRPLTYAEVQQLYNYKPCSTPSEGGNGPCAGIGDLRYHSPLVLYPSPAQDYLMIEGIEAGSEIRITDLRGIALPEFKLAENKVVDVSLLGNGIYFLSFRKGSATGVARFTVMRN